MYFVFMVPWLKIQFYPVRFALLTVDLVDMSGIAEVFISQNTVREMDTWIFAGVIVLIIVAAILAYLNYCGLFHGVEISTGAPFIQNVTFAYKFAKGPYENSGFIFCEASKLAPKAKALGIYYDNPDKVGPI